jgi:hypothetical protein
MENSSTSTRVLVDEFRVPTDSAVPTEQRAVTRSSRSRSIERCHVGPELVVAVAFWVF